MSLTDKVIKNTFYHFISQIIGFLFPFILTPIIISKIGEIEFGIYAITLGFIGTFGLFDLSISTSFIKFISEHYNKRDIKELNNTINTGFTFYLLFSLIICSVGYVLANYLISIINVPPELMDTGIFAIRISLLIFFVANSTTIFVSILISLQKMYVNSLLGIIINFLNFVSIYILLNMGFGLRGLLYSQLAAVGISGFFNFYLAKREMPEMSFSLKNLKLASFKKMSSFGAQMQVSRIASFASEKYDELLLGYFSVLSNVTYFNLAGRVSKLGRFFPFQLFQQVAPVAAELNAKGEKEKLNQLYTDTTKYLTIATLPIFIYIFAFADLILMSWMGEKYTLTVYLLRILVFGQIVNLTLSAPGNAIIPNLGKPKYLMREGIISLGINLVLSFLLIKYLGIIGAALGSTIAIIISSVYIFYSSSRFFKEKKFSFLTKNYIYPLVICVVCCLVTYSIYYLFVNNLFMVTDRFSGVVYLISTGLVFASSYIFWLLSSKYLNQKDKNNFAKLINHISPVKLKVNQ
ncbi:oligosaccharide flippase family protein [Bacteroidota bacterium]